MQYNYDFEIASLLIMTIILLHFVLVRQFPGEKRSEEHTSELQSPC